MAKIIILLGIIAFSAVVHQSNAALKCYQCIGFFPAGTNCYNGILDEKNEQNCSATETKCGKAVVTLTNGTSYVTRACDSSSCSTGELESDPNFESVDCYNCDSDLCNSSEWNSANLLTMCLTVFVANLALLK